MVRHVIQEDTRRWSELKDRNAIDQKKLEALLKHVKSHTNSEKPRRLVDWRLIWELEKLKQEVELLTSGQQQTTSTGSQKNAEEKGAATGCEATAGLMATRAENECCSESEDDDDFCQECEAPYSETQIPQWQHRCPTCGVSWTANAGRAIGNWARVIVWLLISVRCKEHQCKQQLSESPWK